MRWARRFAMAAADRRISNVAPEGQRLAIFGRECFSDAPAENFLFTADLRENCRFLGALNR
jgi:hypothetical protein